MVVRSRSLYLALLGVGYVLVGAFRASPDKGLGIFAALAFVPALVFVWARSAPPARGEDWIAPVSRSAMRACAFGGALLVAARVAPRGSAPFDAVAAVGMTFASVASLVSLARIAPLGGLFVVPRHAEHLGSAWIVLAAGGAAAGLCVVRTVAADGAGISAAAADVAIAAAAVVALVVTIAHAARLRRLRRADLGAPERLSVAFQLGWVGLAVGLPASLFGAAAAADTLSAAAWVVAFASLIACVARDPARVARAQNVLVTAAALSAPAALLALLLSGRAAPRPAPLALVALAAGVAVGLLSVRLSRPRGAKAARWHEALRDATRAALRSEPDAAIAAALSTLRQAFGPSVSAPELWQLDPPQRVVVDLAGYVQAQRTEPVPKELLELARGEPEQTLRTEVLERLEVRRSDVRAPLEWMRARDALALMLLADEDGPIGALLLPYESCPEPFGLEEVRALRALGDRLAALLSVSSTLARSRGRELSAQKAADLHEDRALELEQRVTSSEKRHEGLTARLAHGALVAPYSAPARLACNELERLGKLGSPVSVLTPPGVDPIPYAALVHRAGKNRGGPFVVVDAESARDHLLSTWRDPESSPLGLAHGGTLCIVTVAALPADTQLFLASALAERRSPGEGNVPLDVALVVSVPTTVDALVAAGQLEPSLADRLGDRSVPLPSLAARADDHRALFLERVGRLGLRLRGSPMGLEPRALARLRNHSWPGNDLEANDVLTRAALIASGDVITCDDLDRIGFVAIPPTARRGSRPPTSGMGPGLPH